MLFKSQSMQQPSNTVLLTSITSLLLLLSLYYLKTTPQQSDIDEKSVSICQIRVESDSDDKILLSILAVLKYYDFYISNPTSLCQSTLDNQTCLLIYYCEHKLKTGVQHTLIQRELTEILQKFKLIERLKFHYTFA